ncbi:hypothetical protein E2F43_15120 [Seongchinamella unica]|uniref:Tyr recombinase domain-containing protein n=1 Tax=Seongchinamella unica TaxID=2547392 RepID=A0A4R5LR29_9GAMM|nr:tyrosine-type recombinase/integrase [Seongchinamella unica]TDG12886.1 hypothetical protein E2F43_15120 [Seongchinamella unica]
MLEELLARFVEFMMPVSASGTIERCIASLSTIYRLSDRPNIAQSSEVVLAMKRMYRTKGRVKKQALPLTRDVMLELLAVCENDDRGVRDKLLLRLGYETMRRRSELCSFRFEDMSTLPNGRAALVLRFSKTDQTGVGKLIPISPELVELIEEWRDRTGGRAFY